MAAKRQEHIIQLEAPETPDFAPQISDLRERLARIEERTENPHADPAVAESLSLASAAHQTAEGLRARLESLESASAGLLANANAQAEQLASDVSEVKPPEAIETPPALDPELPATENREPHHPWWNPMRYL